MFQKTTPPRSLFDLLTLIQMFVKSDKTLPFYILLENKLQELELFEPFHIGMFEP